MNKNEILLEFLAMILSKELFDPTKVGFATITKTDTNSFVISDIDEEKFHEYLIHNEGVSSELANSKN